MRLIDADDIVKYSHDVILQGGARHRCFDVTLLHEIPTVEKHGHWDNKIIDARFDTPHTVARCSVCKGKIWVYAENYVVKYPYCPLCGAKMDEVKDESNEV